MICVTDACKQHSGRCPTPWTCGKYASEAHYDAMHKPLYAPLRDLPITFEGPEPKSEGAWSLFARLALVAGVIALWAAVVFVPWPTLAAWLAGSI